MEFYHGEQFKKKLARVGKSREEIEREANALKRLSLLSLPCPKCITFHSESMTILYEVETFEQATEYYNGFKLNSGIDDLGAVYQKTGNYRASVKCSIDPKLNSEDVEILEDNFNCWLSSKASTRGQDASELRFYCSLGEGWPIAEIHVRFTQRINSIQPKHYYTGKTHESAVSLYKYVYQGAEIGIIPFYEFTARESFNTPEFLEFMRIDEPMDWRDLIQQVKVNS